MNSRQRRKIEAQQHNDKLRYEKWLADNTASQSRAPVSANLKKTTNTGIKLSKALILIQAMMLIR